MNKTVSVVMCTYNGAKYIREQLDSIVTQNYPVHELIVQDDCSTDETISIIKEYAKKYDYIKLYVNEYNIGFNRNFKSAVMKATGDYIAISDQDDVWFTQKLEMQIYAIGNHDLCFSSYLRGTDIDSARKECPEYDYERMIFTSCIPGHTMLLRSGFVKQDNNWIDGLFYDWGFALFASSKKGIIRIDEALNWHRVHNKSAIYKIHETKTKYKGCLYPYIMGYKHYRQLQRKILWKRIYSRVNKDTANNKKFELQHTISTLLLSDKNVDILKLMLITAKHRRTIYPKSENTKGLMGFIRGFFFPFIFSKNNPLFD